MDIGLNVNNGGQQLELPFPHIDSSAFESPSSYAEAGPTRNRRSRPHSITPYSRNNSNNNRPTQADDTSKNWLHALINSIMPSFMCNFLGLSSRREGRRGETTLPRADRNNEMDIDQHENLNGTQERLVQSNRIFTEPIQPINNANGLPSRSRRRSGTVQNNAIKRKRPEETSVSIEDVEEKLRRQAQIEDQIHKPDLKELYYKTIDPNWYKPFKSNPDNYPKFASSSKVTSDIYGPDPNLNLPKESPPLKKFKPSVIPTSRWFDYYPVKDEDMIDRRRTENIVEKRKVEEKTIEKEKALHKSKKGKERVDTSLENGKEKPGRTTSISPTHLSPLKDQNYFANILTPVLATSSKTASPSNGVTENQPRLSSTVVSPSKISNTTENKGKNIATTPETAAQNAKSPSSMESIEYTHENKNDDKSPTPVNTVSGNLVSKDKEDKVTTKSIVNNDSLFSSQKNQSQTSIPLVPLEPKPRSDNLVGGEKKNEQISVPPPIEPPKDIRVPQETTKTTPSPIQQENSINGASISSLPGAKDQPLLLLPLNSDNGSNISSSFFNNLKDKAQPPVLVTPLSGKISEKEEKEKKEETKISSSQPQDNPISGLIKENGQGSAATIPPIFGGLSTVGNEASPFTPVFASTSVSTAVSTSVPSFAFGTSTFNGFGSSTFPNDGDNSIGKQSSKHRTYGPHGSRNRRINKRNRTSEIGNETLPNSKNAKTTSIESSTRLQSSFSSKFDFSLPNGSSIAPPLFSSGSETTTQTTQPTFHFGSGGTQTPSTTTSVFGTSITSNSSSLYGTNSISTATPAVTFGFGANATAPASTGFTFGTNVSGNFFGAIQNSTAINGLGTQLGLQTANFSNPTMPNGQSNSSFHSNMTQQNQPILFGSNPNVLESTKITSNSFLQNQPQGSLSFNFGSSNGQGFNSNPSLVPNQNQGFSGVNPSQVNFFSGSDTGQQGSQRGGRMFNGRPIKKPRSRMKH